MKIKYYRISQYLYRVFVGDAITIPQMLIDGFGWVDSNIFKSEVELVMNGAQETSSPY